MFKLLLRHWRGEYPLGRAFWLHGIVTWILVNVAMSGFLLGDSEDGSLTAKMIFAFPLSVALMLVWLFVGIWRSASRARRAGRWFWSLLAQSWIVVVAPQMVLALIIFESPFNF